MEQKELRRIAREHAEDLEEVVKNGTLEEYLEDILDLKFIIDFRGNLNGVELAVTLGGPNIYISTYENQVQVYWGGGRETWCIDSNIADMVTEYFSDIYNFKVS